MGRWRAGGCMRHVLCLFAVICAFPVLATDAAADAADQAAEMRGAVIQGKSVCSDQETSEVSSYDPALRAELWISHLTRFVGVHTELTDEQRSIVLQGRDLVSAGLLRRLHSPDAREAADARTALATFKARASSSFSRDVYAEAFIRLEKPKSPSRIRPPSSAIPMVPDCDCSSATGECPGSCMSGCRATPEGCGTFDGDPCFGLCW
jgi:hypothetical protein